MCNYQNVTVQIKAQILPHPQSPHLLSLPLVALTLCHREETRDCGVNRFLKKAAGQSRWDFIVAAAASGQYFI